MMLLLPLSWEQLYSQRLHFCFDGKERQQQQESKDSAFHDLVLVSVFKMNLVLLQYNLYFRRKFVSII